MRARRGLRVAAATLVVAFLVAGCDGEPTAPTSSLPTVPAGARGVVVDTDMGLGRLTAGAPIAALFRNRSGAGASAVFAGFGGTTTYQDLLDFLGAPGSPITGTPSGFRPVGGISTADGQDGWLALTLERPNLTAACGIQDGETLRAWPGGWLPVDTTG